MKIRATSIILGAICAAEISWGQDPLDTWTTNVVTANGISVANSAFGNGEFVVSGGAVNDTGQLTNAVLLSSYDGITWTPRYGLPDTTFLPLLTWGGGQFVALESLGLLFTSPDAVNWTERNAGLTNAYVNCLTYGSGRFVAGGTANKGLGPALFSSSSGINWSTWQWTPDDPSAPYNPVQFSAVAYGNGQFLALALSDFSTGGIGSVATSPDGVNWTQYSRAGPGVGSGNIGGVTYGNGLFVVVGMAGAPVPGQMQAFVASSPDGTNWTRRLSITNTSGFTSVAYGAGQFVAGISIGSIYTSADGTNWIARSTTSPISDVVFGNGRFLGFSGTNSLQSGVIAKLGANLSLGSGVQGTITGVAGQKYSVQTSSDLTAWSLLTSVTINTNGLAQFSDPLATNYSRRFYDAQLAQQ